VKKDEGCNLTRVNSDPTVLPCTTEYRLLHLLSPNAPPCSVASRFVILDRFVKVAAAIDNRDVGNQKQKNASMFEGYKNNCI